jgi:hypothetical protein
MITYKASKSADPTKVLLEEDNDKHDPLQKLHKSCSHSSKVASSYLLTLINGVQRANFRIWVVARVLHTDTNINRNLQSYSEFR